ncbi:MAG: efflux RND transporter periplasmic adaptor subunit [Parcubacteria group bacterium]|jgi:RND family efflux transporter MFP subunit
MLRKKTIIWSVVAFLFIFGIVYFSFLKKVPVQYETANVQKGEVRETVSASGTLKSNDNVGLNFETPGRIREVDIEVGQKVAKGDVLAILDQTDLEYGVDQARANLEKARADAGITSDSIRTAEVAVENAEDYLDDTKSLNKKNIEASEQTVDDTKNYRDDAESYYNQVKEDDGAGSKAAKLAKLTLDTGQSNYEQAKSALEVAKKNADLSETSADNSLETAKSNLDAAKSKYVTAGNNAVVESYEAAYQTALNNMDKAVLRAPISGVVTEVNYSEGEVIGSPSVTSQTSIFAMMISYDYIFEAKVPESDITKISTNQKADLSFDALSDDDKIAGKVIFVEPSATVVQDVVDYVVKVALDETDSRLRDGMSADIDFDVADRQNVLYIPERAINEENGQKTVDVLTAENKTEKRTVKTGLQGDGGVIEIMSGLQENELVVTSVK